MLTGSQIRAARSLLGWSQTDLAKRARVGEMTVKRFEAKLNSASGTVESLLRMQAALEAAGIIFVSADKHGGIGVRLSK